MMMMVANPVLWLRIFFDWRQNDLTIYHQDDPQVAD
jgi:hypothetical protein